MFSGLTECLNTPPALTTQPMEPVTMANAHSTFSSRPRNISDIYWAAGFLEGEGSFYNHGCPQVSAAQVQKEPLERIVALFGGRTYQRTTGGFSKKPIWIWHLGSHDSVQVMMTLYCLMSPKRQNEIRHALEIWKAARLMKRPGSKICARGHPLEGHNAFIVGKYIQCRACRNLNKRERRKLAA